MLANLLMANDIVYTSEHWLTPDDIHLLEAVSSKHNLFNFQSDMPVSSCQLSRRGRPYGGRCWFVRDTVNVIAYDTPNDIISTLVVEVDRNGVSDEMLIVGVWIHTI